MSDAGPARTARTRVRRERSASESLLSIALILEAVLVFFVTLTVYGLHALPPLVAFVGGVLLLVVLVADSLLVRFPAGVWLGWVLQAVLIAAGILVNLMYFIGVLFLAIWIYCFVTGRKLDRRKAEYLANLPAENL